MDCTEFLHRYSDYDDSLLPPGELSEVRAHLAACAACARYDRVLRKGRMLARQLPAPEPSPDFEGRLGQRLRRSGGSWAGGPRGGRGRGGVVLPGFAAAAMAAVTILLVATSALALLDRLERPGAAARETALAAVVSPPPAMVVPVALEGRSVVLPAAGPRIPRAWSAERVDRRLASSYSPLVTGPPAYRAVRAHPLGPTNPLRRTLD